MPTFEQYINNPAGKGASNTPNKGMYEQYYVAELDKILLKVNGKVNYNLYIDGQKYYIAFKIPHSQYKDFFYDVVVEFYTDDNAIKVLKDLKKYNVRFFSNDPSFTFTWAYAFNKQDLIIKKLKSKLSPLSLKQAPVVRNPSESTGYNRFLYYAYLLAKLYNLFDKAEYTLKSKPLSSLPSTIMSSDKKLEERKKKEEEYKKQPKSKKENEQIENRTKTPENISSDKLITKTPMTKKTKFTDRLNGGITKSKTTSRVKFTKKI